MVVAAERKEYLNYGFQEVPREKILRKKMKKINNNPASKLKKLLASCLLLIFSLGLLLTYEASYLAVKTYQLGQLKREVSTLEKNNEKLHLEVVKLRSPDRIALIATNQLKMQFPTTTNIAYLLPAEQKEQKPLTNNGSEPVLSIAGEKTNVFEVSPFFGNLAQAFEQLLKNNRDRGNAS